MVIRTESVSLEETLASTVLRTRRAAPGVKKQVCRWGYRPAELRHFSGWWKKEGDDVD